MEKVPLKQTWWQPALEVFTRLSAWVILPLIVGTTLGRWLDRRNDTGSKWFFICIGIAFVISTYGMIQQARREYAKLAPPPADKKPESEDISDNERTARDN